jgi:type IX secretion system PorP/SprF family membrane protein
LFLRDIDAGIIKGYIIDFRIMTRIKLTFFSLFLSVFTIVPGQAIPDSTGISLGYPVYSQYLQNGLLINPAYAGSRGALSGFLSYRMQWMGISDAPKFQSVSLHTPMKNDKVALGLMAQFMQFGFTKSQSIYASYAYHIRLGNGKLSFGLKGGFDRSNTDYTDILLTDSADPVFAINDKPYFLPNVGAGVYFFSEKLFAGVSVPQFLSYRESVSGSPQAYHSFNEYDLIFSAGGLITFSQFFKFKPSVLLDYSLQDTKKLTQLDINGNFILADLIWVGGSYRTSEEVAVAILQLQVNPQFMFGFSYDYPVGRMNSYSKGSSEFIIRYEFGSKVSAANPRYF